MSFPSFKSIRDSILSSKRIWFFLKYGLPILILILLWGIASVFFMLSVTERDCEATNGIITNIKDVSYKTHSRRWRERSRHELHITINSSRVFILDKNTYDGYELRRTELGIFVPNFKMGDTVTIYSYQGPAYIMGALKENIFKIENKRAMIIPETVYYENREFGLKVMGPIFIIFSLLYYLTIVRPWMREKKVAK